MMALRLFFCAVCAQVQRFSEDGYCFSCGHHADNVALEGDPYE